MGDPLNREPYFDLQGAEEQAAFLTVIEDVLKTEHGRRFIWEMIKRSGLLNNAMTGNSWTYFVLGQQQPGNELMQILQTERFLLLYRKMQDEALLREKAKQQGE